MPKTTTIQPGQTPSSPKERLVELRDIVLQYGDKKILDGVSMEVYRDEVVAVVGPSGTGKSTLIKIISGLLIPDGGEVTVHSEKIGLAFQYGALFSSMTVAENLAFALEQTTDLEDDEIERRTREALELVGLADDGHKLPGELSGGMQKRVGIARALVIHPDIMLYDEPSAGLDPILAHQLEQDLGRINREMKMASVLVTHEMPSIENMADRVIMLYEGKIVYQGSKEDFFGTDEPHARQFRNRQPKGPIQV